MSVAPALGDGFLVRIRDAVSSRALLRVTKHVSGKFEGAARSEKAAIEHGQGESAGFGQLKAGASELPEPRGLDLLLARGRVEQCLGLVRQQGVGFRSEQPSCNTLGAGRLLRYPQLD